MLKLVISCYNSILVKVMMLLRFTIGLLLFFSGTSACIYYNNRCESYYNNYNYNNYYYYKHDDYYYYNYPCKFFWISPSPLDSHGNSARKFCTCTIPHKEIPQGFSVRYFRVRNFRAWIFHQNFCAEKSSHPRLFELLLYEEVGGDITKPTLRNKSLCTKKRRGIPLRRSTRYVLVPPQFPRAYITKRLVFLQWKWRGKLSRRRGSFFTTFFEI